MVTFTRKRPLGLFGQMVLGLIFLGVGSAFLVFVAADYSLFCNRSEDLCSLHKKRMFREREAIAQFAVQELQGAEIQESRDSKGKSHYQVMLVTTNIRIPYTDGMNLSYGECSKTTAEVNSFLKSTKKQLSLTQSGLMLKLFGLLFGLLFAAIGAYVVLQSLLVMVRRVVRGM